MTTLSICVPTYNRSTCLAELLDSIVAQNRPDVEVIVSDDASPDDSTAVAEAFRDRITRLTVIRHPTNIGLDRNFMAAVEAATSDYVWLMGDDDRIEPNGVSRVFDALAQWPGISGLTVGVIDYDPSMRHPTGVRGMPTTRRIETASELFSTMVENLGFMSALVINRAMWMEVAHEPSAKAFENYYVQVYILGRVVQRHGGWGVVQEACVGFRTSNDQFLTRFGWLKRLEIDVTAYAQLAEGLFKDDPAAKAAIARRVFSTHVMGRLRNAKIAAGPTPAIARAGLLLFGHYKSLPAFWTNGLPTLLAPKWAVHAARRVYRRFARSSGVARARVLLSP